MAENVFNTKNEHEVSFFDWCPKCKYAVKSDTDEPCNSCLDTSAVINSTKPVKFEEAK